MPNPNPQQLSQAQLAESRRTAVQRWPGINYVGKQGWDFLFTRNRCQIGKVDQFHIAEIGVFRAVRSHTDRAGRHSLDNLRALEPALIRVLAHDGPFFSVELLDPLTQINTTLRLVEGNPQPELYEDQEVAQAQPPAEIIGAIGPNRADGPDAGIPPSDEPAGAIGPNRADAPSDSDHSILFTTDNSICACPSPSRDYGGGAIGPNRAGQSLPSRSEQLARKQRQDADVRASEEPSSIHAAMTDYLSRGPQNVAATRATIEKQIQQALNDPRTNAPDGVHTSIIASVAQHAEQEPKHAKWLSNLLQKMIQKHGGDPSPVRRCAYFSLAYKRQFLDPT